MRITKALLKEWSACTSGYGWFIQRFPQGASCHEVARALRKDKRYDDERWLFSNVFNKFVAQPEIIADVVKKDTETQICAGTALIAKLAESADKSDGSLLAASGRYSLLAASGYGSQLAASGYGSQLAASGRYSQLAASGSYSLLAASGYGSQLAASGSYSLLAASGNGNQLAASGYGSQLAASGSYSLLAASGTRSVAVAAGFGSSASAGENGAFALPWLDGEQVRIAVGIVGENGIKAGVLYRVDGAGTLIEAGA